VWRKPIFTFFTENAVFSPSPFDFPFLDKFSFLWYDDN